MTPPPRSLPSAIGGTENALRALLELVLEHSGIDGYDEWVALNIVDRTRSTTDAIDEIARALATSRTEAGRAVDALVGKRLVTVLRDSSEPSASGRALLAELRARIGEATRGLVDGLDDADLETTLRVLDHLRDAATRAMASQVQA